MTRSGWRPAEKSGFRALLDSVATHFGGHGMTPKEHTAGCGIKEGEEWGGPSPYCTPIPSRAGDSKPATRGATVNIRPWKWEPELGPALETVDCGTCPKVLYRYLIAGTERLPFEKKNV